jgi:hypothetical protein
MTPCICAIDPGKKGAIAFYFPEFDRMSVEDMPMLGDDVDVRAMADRLTQMAPTVAWIERVGPRPKEAAKYAFAFGEVYAAVKAVVRLSSTPLHLVTPAKWKAAMKVPGGPEGKTKARSMASDLWPSIASEFRRVKDDGRAEAALLALYGAQTGAIGAKVEFATLQARATCSAPAQVCLCWKRLWVSVSQWGRRLTAERRSRQGSQSASSIRKPLSRHAWPKPCRRSPS